MTGTSGPRAGPRGPTQAIGMLLDAWSTCWLRAVILTGCCPSRHRRRVCRRLVAYPPVGEVIADR